MAGDPRPERTRQRLRAALLDACVQRPLTEISIADVVRRAELGRATFYLHYDSLDALALDACAATVGTAVDALHAFGSRPDPVSPPVEVAELFTDIDRQATLYRALTRPGGGGPLGERLHAELAERATVERRRRGIAGPAEDVVASAVAATVTGVLADWLHGRITGTPDEVAGRLWPLLAALHAAGGRGEPAKHPRTG